MTNLTADYRISTEKQGRSGLGLEARQAAAAEFARHSDANVLAGYTEVETGKEHGASFKGNFGIFDAADLRGPWTTAGYYQNWGEFGSTFFWNLSKKWLSTDGKNFTLIFTGTGANDSWNTVRGEFTQAPRKDSASTP